jgi:tryptophanyl-tRNA synthetase
MLTGEVKAKLIAVLQQLVKEHQERRAKITDEDIRKFMRIHALKPTPRAAPADGQQ